MPLGDGLVLTNRRAVGRLNSVDYAGRDEPVVRVYPSDAAGLGDRVEVVSAHGRLTAPLRVDEGVRPGTVSVNHGQSGADVAALTSAVVDVDPLTGMPLVSGLPVRLLPA